MEAAGRLGLRCNMRFRALVLVLGALASSLAAAAGDHRSPKKVLVTGFGPFRNFTDNPSGDVALLLNGTCHDDASFCIEGMKLPVDDAGVRFVETELTIGNPEGWSGIIHLGLENKAKGLKVEVAALNNRASDNRTVVGDGPTILPTTLDLGNLRLPRALLSALANSSSGSPGGALELWSRDAGDYYCNEIFYRTLWAVRVASGSRRPREGSRSGLLPVVFVHLPEPTRAITLEVMGDIVAAIASVAMGGEERRQSTLHDFL